MTTDEDRIHAAVLKAPFDIGHADATLTPHGHRSTAITQDATKTVKEGRAKHRVAWKQGAERLWLSAQRTWYGSAFMSVWVLIWIWSGVRTAIANFSDPATVAGLVLRLLVAISTTVLLAGQIVGVDLVEIRRGKLVITQRAGAFPRIWRYGTAMVRNLRTDLSPWTGRG